MSLFANALKQEIARVARKEMKDEILALRKATTAHRSEITSLKRELKSLASLLRQAQRAVKTAAASAEPREARHSRAPSGSAPSRGAVNALNFAFVVCADHELSPPTFAARVAASAGAELRACLLAAIGTHSGMFMAGGCDQSEALLRAARNPQVMRELMLDLERLGGRIPGYNLKAYPHGDPRARKLLDIAAGLGREGKRMQALISAVEQEFDLRPSLEVGLIALTAALDLPPRSASAIWAIVRCAGWIAHVIEQRQAAFMVRPRARYIGPQ